MKQKDNSKQQRQMSLTINNGDSHKGKMPSSTKSGPGRYHKQGLQKKKNRKPIKA